MVSPSRPRRHPPRLAAIMLALAVCGCEAAHTRPMVVPQAGRTVPVYCYQTLADVACYPAPDAGRERQLLGIYRSADLPALSFGTGGGTLPPAEGFPELTPATASAEDRHA